MLKSILAPLAIVGVVATVLLFRGGSGDQAPNPEPKLRYKLIAPTQRPLQPLDEALVAPASPENSMILDEFLKTLRSLPASTQLDFLARRSVGKAEGKFDRHSFSARIDARSGKLISFEGLIDLDSLTSPDAALVGRIRHGSMFGQPDERVCRFRSTRITHGNPGQFPNRADTLIEGELTFAGTTQPVAIPVRTHVSDSQEMSVQGDLLVDRKAFGLPLEERAEGSIRNDLLIRLNILAGDVPVNAVENAPEKAVPDAMKAARDPNPIEADNGHETEALKHGA